MPKPMPQTTEFYGTFICQTCELAVPRARFWYNESKDMTWKCSEGHISKVSLRKPTKQEIKAMYEGR